MIDRRNTTIKNMETWLKKHRLLGLAIVLGLLMLCVTVILARNDLILHARIVGILLVFLLISTWRYYTVQAWLSERRINNEGVQVIGIVLDLEERHGMTASTDFGGSFVDDYWVTYKFTPIEGQELSSRKSIDSELFINLQIEGIITVSYDSSDPTKNVPVSSTQYKLSFWKVFTFTWNTLFFTALALAAIPLGLITALSQS